MPHQLTQLPHRRWGQPRLGTAAPSAADPPDPRRHGHRSASADTRTPSRPTGAPDAPEPRPARPRPSSRVAGAHYGAPAPSEPAVPVSGQPAQASPDGERSGLQKCWSTAGAAWRAVSAVGMDETKHGDRVRFPGPCVEGQRAGRDRLASGCDPAFLLVGVSRFVVGMEQQLAAERASPALPVQEP
jgi:hypothetical protein